MYFDARRGQNEERSRQLLSLAFMVDMLMYMPPFTNDHTLFTRCHCASFALASVDHVPRSRFIQWFGRRLRGGINSFFSDVRLDSSKTATQSPPHYAQVITSVVSNGMTFLVTYRSVA